MTCNLLFSSSQINAMANKAAGKGYESTDFYENVKFQFVGIENIHVMRQSLQKMIERKTSITLHTHTQNIQNRTHDSNIIYTTKWQGDRKETRVLMRDLASLVCDPS